MEFKTVNKTFVKSKNSVKKIYLNYTYSLIGFIALLLGIYFIMGYKDEAITLLTNMAISILTASIVAYIINIIKKKPKFMDIYMKDNIHIIALVIALCAGNVNPLILIGSVTISVIIKTFVKGINISSSLYGILIIILYKYFTNDLVTPLTKLQDMQYIATYHDIIGTKKDIIPYLIGVIYVSPILSICAFFYLFFKKSIKYNMLVSYTLTFSFIMLIYGIFNNMAFWFLLLEIVCGNILFLCVYAFSDYGITPTLGEGQVLYGITLGTISAILRFIIPEIAVIITFICGELILTKLFEKLSIKLKYNKKLYNLLFIVGIILMIITIALLTILY